MHLIVKRNSGNENETLCGGKPFVEIKVLGLKLICCVSLRTKLANTLQKIKAEFIVQSILDLNEDKNWSWLKRRCA